MVLRIGHPSKKGATDTSDARLDFRNRYVCNADGSPHGGVTSPVGVALLSPTSTMNVAVAAFSAVTVRDGGVVEMANDGPVNVLLDPAPSSQSRIDVVYAKQNDSSSTVSVPDGNDLPVFGVLKGNTSATPVKRTDLPPGAVELGTVLVPSGSSATNSAGVVITTTCAYTAASGGTVPFRTLSDLNAWSGTPQRGQQAIVFADTTAVNNSIYTYSGSIWLASQSMVGVVTSGGSITGWTPGTAPNTPRILREGNKRTLYGAVVFGTGASWANLLTVAPADAPPTSGQRSIGLCMAYNTPNTLYVQMGIASGAVGQVIGSASLPGGITRVYLDGLSWYLD